MKFGSIWVQDAQGSILAHSHRVGKRTFKKGRVLTDEDVQALREAGYEDVVAATLESGDVSEDAAAARLVKAIKGESLRASEPFTGRCNLFAECDGLLVVDEMGLKRLNFITEELTLATLPGFSVVSARQMVATVKVIPFSAPESELALCEELAADAPLIRVVEFQSLRVGLIQTRMNSTKESVLDKTTWVLRERIERLGGDLIDETRCAHLSENVSKAIHGLLAKEVDLLLIAGASAIVDRRDVIPSGIRLAGGDIEHFGMPVDPGNLLLLARKRQVLIVGLPGCARSPKPSGFDGVLQRISAGIPVVSADIMAMGSGGLLKEYAGRPSPRGREDIKAPARAARIMAIVLAAGQSRRMGKVNKLLSDLHGEPMIVRVVEAAMASDATEVLVVTGHEKEQVEAALVRHEVSFAHNPNYEGGLSTSLYCALCAIRPEIEGALICLGDMPALSAHHLNRLVAGFDPVEGRAICVPTFRGKRGNPVLFAREFFAEIKEIQGDVGAKHLLGEHEEQVCEIEMSDNAVTLDIDSFGELSEFLEASGQ